MESIAAVTPIINMGGDEYAKLGIGKSTGTKLISACGHINKPGVYEIDMTISVEEFIYSDEYCGGIRNGKKMKAVVAVQRKLLELIYTIFKTQKPYDKDFLQKTREQQIVTP